MGCANSGGSPTVGGRIVTGFHVGAGFGTPGSTVSQPRFEAVMFSDNVKDLVAERGVAFEAVRCRFRGEVAAPLATQWHTAEITAATFALAEPATEVPTSVALLQDALPSVLQSVLEHRAWDGYTVKVANLGVPGVLVHGCSSSFRGACLGLRLLAATTVEDCSFVSCVHGVLVAEDGCSLRGCRFASDLESTIVCIAGGTPHSEGNAYRWRT